MDAGVASVSGSTDDREVVGAVGVHSDCLYLDGETLSPADLRRLSYGKCRIMLSEQARMRVRDGRMVVDRILQEGKIAYGINTGFGLFSKVNISGDKLEELQVCISDTPTINADHDDD